MEVKHLHGTTGRERKIRARIGKTLFEVAEQPQCPLFFKTRKRNGVLYMSRCANYMTSKKGGYAVAHVNAHYLGKHGRPTTGFVPSCSRCNNMRAIESQGGVQYVKEEYFIPSPYGYKTGNYEIDDTIRRNPYEKGHYDRMISSSSSTDWYYVTDSDDSDDSDAEDSDDDNIEAICDAFTQLAAG
jgi:hypothetical protein